MNQWHKLKVIMLQNEETRFAILPVLLVAFSGIPTLLKILFNQRSHFSNTVSSTGLESAPILKLAAVVYLLAILLILVGSWQMLSTQQAGFKKFIVGCLIAAIGFKVGSFVAPQFPSIISLPISRGVTGKFQSETKLISVSIQFIVPLLLLAILRRKNRLVSKKAVKAVNAPYWERLKPTTMQSGFYQLTTFTILLLTLLSTPAIFRTLLEDNNVYRVTHTVTKGGRSLSWVGLSTVELVASLHLLAIWIILIGGWRMLIIDKKGFWLFSTGCLIAVIGFKNSLVAVYFPAIIFLPKAGLTLNIPMGGSPALGSWFLTFSLQFIVPLLLLIVVKKTK